MARDYPVELFADDIAGVIYGPRNCKVVFTSQQPGGDDGPVEAEVLTLVMPTDALIAFCLYTVSGFARHAEQIAENSSGLHGNLSIALDAIQEVVKSKDFNDLKDVYFERKEEPKEPARKRAKAKAH